MSRPPSLTREQALAIRETYVRYRVNISTLAARYGVSISTISNILKGRTSTVSGLPDIARPKLMTVRGKYSNVPRPL